VKIRSNIREEEVRVLFDTGASRIFIRGGIVKKSQVKLTRPRIARRKQDKDYTFRDISR